jgi:hypothetical protein
VTEQTGGTAATEEPNSGQEPQEKAFEAITSQDDLNRIIGERVARERAKYSNHAEGQAALAKLAEIENAQKSAEQKAAEALAAAEKRAADAESKALRAEVAASKGVPVELIAGSTKDEMEAAADSLIKFRDEKPSPRSPRPDMNQGKPPATGGTAGDQFAAFLTEALGQ